MEEVAAAASAMLDRRRTPRAARMGPPTRQPNPRCRTSPFSPRTAPIRPMRPRASAPTGRQRGLAPAPSHYVPEQPDNVPEQIALIARAIAARPDAAVFMPVHETAVNDAILAFDARAHSAVQHRDTHDRRRAAVLCRLGRSRAWRRTSRAICSRSSADAEKSSSSRARRHRRRAMRDARDFTTRSRSIPEVSVRLSLCGEYQRDVACKVLLAAPTRCGTSMRSYVPTTPWRSACWMRWGRAGRSRRPLVVGVNAIPEAIAAIAAGRMLATVNFDAMTMSSIATEAAVRHLRGETRSARDHPPGADRRRGELCKMGCAVPPPLVPKLAGGDGVVGASERLIFARRREAAPAGGRDRAAAGQASCLGCYRSRHRDAGFTSIRVSAGGIHVKLANGIGQTCRSYGL